MDWLPTPAAVKDMHYELVTIFESEEDPISPPGVKSEDLLESACTRPHTSLGETEKYPTLIAKLAALFHSLTKNHAFHNGNKRTALVTLLTALHRNDRRLRNSVSDADVYNIVVAVSENTFPRNGCDADEIVKALEHWIRENTEGARGQLGTMKVTDFIKKCEMAGASVERRPGGAHIAYNGKSIRLSGSTRQLNGHVIARYLRILGLNPARSGMDVRDFMSGASPERRQMYRFMAALRRLAKT